MMPGRRRNQRRLPRRHNPMAEQLSLPLYKQRRVRDRTKDEPRRRKHKEQDDDHGYTS